MKAIVFDTPGDAHQLHLADVPDPAPAAPHVLLHIAATALNRADLLQREGKYPVPEGGQSYTRSGGCWYRIGGWIGSKRLRSG